MAVSGSDKVVRDPTNTSMSDMTLKIKMESDIRKDYTVEVI
jgi:hypothetical protein